MLGGAFGFAIARNCNFRRLGRCGSGVLSAAGLDLSFAHVLPLRQVSQFVKFLWHRFRAWPCAVGKLSVWKRKKNK